MELAKAIQSVFLAVVVGNVQGILQAHLVEAPQLPDPPGGVFQHRVDIGAELGGVHRGLLPLPGPQTVVEKIGQAALGLLVHLGGGKIQAVAVEGADVLGADPAQVIIQPLQGALILRLHPQPLRDALLAVGSKIGPGFQFIGIGKAQVFLRLRLAPRQLGEPPVNKGGLLAGAVHPYGFRRPAEHTVNLREFRLDALHGPAGEGHPQLAQGHPLLVRQDTGGAGIAGQVPLLGPQHHQVFGAVAPHGAHRAKLHHIQHRRDGAHVVLA